MHINIGGGSDDGLKQLTEQVGDLEGMANITFAWMIDRVRQFTKLKFNDEMLKYVVARYMDNMAAVLERQIQANAEAAKSTSGIYAALKSVFVAKKPVCRFNGQKGLLRNQRDAAVAETNHALEFVFPFEKLLTSCPMT